MKIASRALILHEKNILLVKHKGRDFYSLPGGKVDDDEDIQSALAREIREELGKKALIEKLLFLHEFRYPEGSLSLEFFFLVANGKDFLGTPQGDFADIELEEISWVPIKDMKNIMPPFLKGKLLHICSSSPLEYHSFV
jgi:8-oxo-dGTP pyrophosphatase MutT (NUDIX family)